MPNAVETYIRAWSEHDPAARAKMIEACFAEDGRIVTRSRQIRGRAALADEMATVVADPQIARIRILSAVDVAGTTFRFRSAVDRHDGKTMEFFDAGELDDSGRIALLLTFAGPLAEPEPTA